MRRTRYAPQGVIPIDNTFYVSPSDKHYALEFRRFRKQADCDAKRAELEQQPGGFDAPPPAKQRLAIFKNHTAPCGELIDWVGSKPFLAPLLLTATLPTRRSVTAFTDTSAPRWAI